MDNESPYTPALNTESEATPPPAHAHERIAALVGLDPASPRLSEALTHPSYANERKDTRHNQRFEFLGDAVLGFCVSEVLFERFPEAPEGILTRLRAQLVNGEALAAWGRSIGLQLVLRFGKGAQAAGLEGSLSVLADAVEALIAAVYLDAGLDRARELCAQIIESPLQAAEQLSLRDPKSELQERLQSTGRAAPAYNVAESGGPAHKRWFRIQVLVQGEVWGEGKGTSKRAAERAAAAEALQRFLLQQSPPPSSDLAEA